MILLAKVRIIFHSTKYFCNFIASIPMSLLINCTEISLEGVTHVRKDTIFPLNKGHLDGGMR